MIVTYSVIFNITVQDQPQLLSAVDETNHALRQILGFTIGYYCSVLQVTGNSSYAKSLAARYLDSGLVNIARTYPEWAISLDVNSLDVSTRWLTHSSYSMGNMAVNYSLNGLGTYGITYQTSCKLAVQIENEASGNYARLTVIKDDGEPLINLGRRNFKFYRYIYTNSAWQLITPVVEPMVFANGTYIIQPPSGIDPRSYVIQVEDYRGITVVASSFNHYTITLAWNSTFYSQLQDAILTVELLQNGTMRWLGQNLQITTQTKPFPPIPVKAIHVNQTVNGVNQEVPFQIEDWASNYQVPLGLTNNASLFSSRTMLVFLVNPKVSKVTIWWDGSDSATQTPNAYTNRYFKDNPDNGILTNGKITLNIYTSESNFKVISTVGESENTATFMQINNEQSVYGAKPAYCIYNGTVRDIIHQEAEWNGGADNCPNLYAHIVLTLPANVTYYTYQLRLMFVQSQQSRRISDLTLIQLTTTVQKSKWGSDWSKTLTENGTSSGYPTISNTAGFFYNLSNIWQHHWSEFIENNHGFGVMATTNGNNQLYLFDSIAGSVTGGINVMDSRVRKSQTATLEVKPVSLASASFTYSLDAAWHGAVVTFDGQNSIYSDTEGNTGLWVIVEYPPTITIATES